MICNCIACDVKDILLIAATEQGKDNRGLHDLDSNQKLSRDDIELMKKTGMEGEVIIC